MFGMSRSEFRCLERYAQNFNVGKDWVRITMFGKIR